MDIINAFFGKLVFSKVDHKEDFTVYAAFVRSSYGDGRKQYALAFVPSHLAIVDQGYLGDLYWKNVQTRMLQNGYKIPPQKWTFPAIVDLPMFNIVERATTKSTYTNDNNTLEMVLIHDPKKKSTYQYHNRINLIAALSTYRCVISTSEIINPPLQPSKVNTQTPNYFPDPGTPYDTQRENYQTIQTMNTAQQQQIGQNYTPMIPKGQRFVPRTTNVTANKISNINSSFELIEN